MSQKCSMLPKSNDKLFTTPVRTPQERGAGSRPNPFRDFLPWNIVMILLCVLPPPRAFSSSDITRDSAAMASVRLAINRVYNLEFREADPIIKELETAYPDYPGMPVLRSFYLYWKYRPIKPDTEAFHSFERVLRTAMQQSQALLDVNSGDEEGIFFAMVSRAYLALMYTENGMNMKALIEAKSAYGYLKKGFDLLEQNPEFYFSSGIYNYYRVKFPEENPFFKPFMWFFASGDKEMGMQMLRTGAEMGIFTRVECLHYLWSILLHYEYQPHEALPHAQRLHEDYPANLHFVANYIETLMELNELQDALPLILNLKSSKEPYYQYLGYLFHGYYLENHTEDLSGARALYEKSMAIGQGKKVDTPHHNSLLYAGMGRTAVVTGEADCGKSWFQLALKSAEYTYVRQRIQAELKRIRSCFTE